MHFLHPPREVKSIVGPRRRPKPNKIPLQDPAKCNPTGDSDQNLTWSHWPDKRQAISTTTRKRKSEPLGSGPILGINRCGPAYAVNPTP